MLVAHLFLHEAVSIPMLNQMRDIRMPQTVQSQLFRQPSFGAKLGKPAIKITPRDASPSLGNPDSIEVSGIKPIASLRNPLPHTRDPPLEEHTSELQSRGHLVCRLLLEKKKCQTGD